MPLPRAVRERIDAIRSDRTRGAAELAQAAAEALLLAADATPDALAEAARLVTEAQPTMAPLVNLARAAVSANAIRAFLTGLREAGPRVATFGAALVPGGGAILTHSSSAAVFDALLLAWRQGKRFRVFATESRPLCEGATLAQRLGREGVPVILIVDAAFASALSECQLALVGADAVSPRGVVNKTGTLAIALAASALCIPLYALCGSQKFLPGGYELPPEPPKDPREIVGAPGLNVSVQNYYFDLTPLHLFTGIITEEGIRTTSWPAAATTAPP
jgi:translation initiation factor eIF-2B subunit delta